MQDLVANLTSLAWWFSAVIVALLINLLSAYTKPWVDRRLSSLSSAWRGRSEIARAKFENEVERLVLSPQALAEASEQEVRSRSQSLYLMIFALLFTVTALTISAQSVSMERYSPVWYFMKSMGVFGLLTMVSAASPMHDAMALTPIIRAARRILSGLESKRREP